MASIRDVVTDMSQGTLYSDYWQRDWSWNSARMTCLWDSLYRGLPIGLFTFWEQGNEEGNPERLIVDGQQRLISIYSAMKDEMPPTLDPNAPSPPMGMVVNVLDGTFKFPTERQRAMPHWMQVSHIMQDNAAELEKMEAALRPKWSAEKWRTCLRNIRNIQNIAERQVMVSHIPSHLTLNEVLELFTRMQNNGKSVSSSDIDVMWISPRWNAARREISRMVEDWKGKPLGRMINVTSIVRLMGILMHGKHLSHGLSRSGANREMLEQTFRQASQYMDVIAETVEQRLAIRDPNVFRTMGPATVLARYLHLNGGTFPTAADELKAMAYLLTASIRGYRSGSASTYINQELAAVELPDPWSTLRKITDTNNGTLLAEAANFTTTEIPWKSHHALLLALRMRKGCRDWILNTDLRESNPETLESLRIFPRELLANNEQFNSLTNTVLVSAKTMASLRDNRSPAEFLNRLFNYNGSLFQQQQMPTDPELWQPENFRRMSETRALAFANAGNAMVDSMWRGEVPQA